MDRYVIVAPGSQIYNHCSKTRQIHFYSLIRRLCKKDEYGVRIKL